jgi:MAF protein
MSLTDQPLILASGSPRRRAFLEGLGLPFEVRVADIDERSVPGELPEHLVARLSREKARAVAATVQGEGRIVVAADTIVTLEGALLGKPGDTASAIAMLRRLRDRPHQVYSGVSLVVTGGDTPEEGKARLTEVVESTVWMRAYMDDEIAAYVQAGSPLDKAGAYGIQDAGFSPVARLRGCYASVMGLPLCALANQLRRVRPEGTALGDALAALDVPAACQAMTGVACCAGERAEQTFTQ